MSGDNDPRQVAASVIGLITALMAIAYTTKLMHGTLFQKSAKQTQFVSGQTRKVETREKVRR